MIKQSIAVSLILYAMVTVVTLLAGTFCGERALIVALSGLAASLMALVVINDW